MAQNKKRLRLILILAGVILVLVIIILLKGKSSTKATEVDFATVERRSITEKVSASGKIYPRIEVKVSSDVSGEVVALYVSEGDTVRAGQLLAKIDPEAYVSAVERVEANVLTAKSQAANSNAAIEQARSQKEQIEAQLTNQRELHRRNEKLHKEKVISDVEFDQSLAALRSLEANLKATEAGINAAKELAKGAEYNVKSAEAGLREIRTNLRRTSIVAPMSGVISLLNVKQGERVVGTIQMAGTEILRIADFSAIEVQADVSENEILRIGVGNEAEIEVDAYVGRKFSGKVTQIANTLSGGAGALLGNDQATKFVVKVLIDPSSYQDISEKTKRAPFRPGMSATVDILTNTVTDALSVPIQAVTMRDDNKSNKKEQESTDKTKDFREVVFVMANDTVRAVNVKTGIQDDRHIQIIEGLNGNETVISGPYSTVSRKLNTGDRVTKRKKIDPEKAKSKQKADKEEDQD